MISTQLSSLLHGALAISIIAFIIGVAVLIKTLLTEYERLQLESAIIEAISKGNYRNGKPLKKEGKK